MKGIKNKNTMYLLEKIYMKKTNLLKNIFL